MYCISICIFKFIYKHKYVCIDFEINMDLWQILVMHLYKPRNIQNFPTAFLELTHSLKLN